MKKTVKRLMVFFIMTIILTTNIFADISINNKTEEMYLQEEKSLQSYKQIQEIINYNIELAEYYGGAYIDDEGYLNINIKNHDNKFNIEDTGLKMIQDSNEAIKYHYVKKTKKELKEAVNKLNNRMKELAISQIELSEKNNKVYIYMNNIEDMERKEQIMKLVDSEAIEFKQTNKQLEIKVGEFAYGSYLDNLNIKFLL
ncbi:hypothetical protein SH1V18_20580 [Vallitalea longa]|uniref:Uncharacterized protein n=1 Tax=Vallitalea longa TaxID=2936439 RepID=A0A9W5YE76_9FIRM|nr:hypothetical protein [Vallitalea longa]GKX29578.1 hypothetical protein SH1V18_20580 [Vallitalea longa]